MNYLLRRIPFSVIYEHIQVSLLLGRITKGNLVCYFHSFLKVIERGFCRKAPISTGRNDRLKLGKLLSLIECIGNNTRQFHYHCFNRQGTASYQTPGLFIDSPGSS